MLTPAMAQEVWKSPERPSIEKRPGRCANTYLTRLSDACARSTYRMKVGVPLDAAPYGVRASA